MRCCLQDEIASMLVDGRLKAIVDSEFPFSQQGVTDMYDAPFTYARSSMPPAASLMSLTVSPRSFQARAWARTF